MKIDVAFTPTEVQALSNKICVVIDVVRATSSLAIILSKKPAKVVLATTIQKATKFASQLTVHPLLCGERNTKPPKGFDFGNSPVEYSKANLTDKTIIFTSSNGTRAIAEIMIAPYVYLGSFLNASAVVQKTIQKANALDMDILLVCAGREEKFAVDDAYCAGFFISQLISSLSSETNFELADGGQAALGIYGYYRDPLRLIEMSGAGKALIEIGLKDDLAFLVQKDLYNCVPELINKNNAEPETGFSLLF